MMHVVLAVGFGPEVGGVTDVEPMGGGGGTTQVDWHDAACALQLIMQFVVADVCANRIFPRAAASPIIAAAATKAHNAASQRMSCPPRPRSRIAMDGYDSPAKRYEELRMSASAAARQAVRM